MRLITTLSLLVLFSLGAFSQPTSGKSDEPVYSLLEKGLLGRMGCGIVQVQPPKKERSDTTVKIRLHCCRTLTSSDELLFVIDGIPAKGEKLSELKVEMIESIWVLKNAEATAIYGSEGINGVIIISTKKSTDRKFIINDFLDGNAIAGATVSFISANKKDTLYFIANDSGVVITNKLKISAEYEITVSSVGYKTVSQLWKNTYRNKTQELLIERSMKDCEEAIVSTISCFRKRSCICYSVRTYNIGDVPAVTSKFFFKIYPNPLSKGAAFNIQFNNEDNSDKTVRVLSTDGKIMLQQTFKTNKENDLFQVQTDARWSAGTYFIQLVYENGRILASDKLIIQ